MMGSSELTAREVEILSLMAEGLSNKKIAGRLFLAEKTVRWYNSQIYSKLHVSSRREAVEQANALALLQLKHSDATVPHNLPAQTTPFIGREQELSELTQLFADENVRLVTILAPGGMGKTRLALELSEQFARSHQQEFRDGVFYVPLQPLADSQNIVSQIANSINLQVMGAESDPQAQLLAYLADKRALLLMDNWEHLLDGVSLVTDILRAASGVRILSTSREQLRLSGETVYSLMGMRFPTWETPEDALAYDAVQLLLQSAQRIKHDWTLTADKLDYVARICRLTEGMPLGIVLAASWLDALSLKDIADEIQSSVDFLAAELRDMPERQRSVRAVFDYAWKRLTSDEQRVFMQLSVFRGGFTRQAAQTVAGSRAQILQTLVNKAMVTRDNQGRYDIHELLRQYAEDQLHAAGLDIQTFHKHGQFFAEYAEIAEPDLRGARHIDVSKGLEQEHDNLCIAMRRSLDGEDSKPALRIMAALRDFWIYNANYLSWSWFEEGLLRLDGVAPLLRGRTLISAASVAGRLGGFSIVRDCAQQALEIMLEIGNKRYIAWAKMFLVYADNINFDGKKFERTISAYDEIMKLLHEVGDAPGIVQALNLKGHTYFNNNDYSRAYNAYEQCLEAARHTGEARRIYISLYNMGKVAFLQADYDSSRRLICEAIAHSFRIENTGGLGTFLTILAGPLSALGEVEQAARSIGAADAFFESLGVEMQKGGGSDILAEQIRQTLRETLGEPAFEGAYQAGRAISIDDAAAEALSWLDRGLRLPDEPDGGDQRAAYVPQRAACERILLFSRLGVFQPIGYDDLVAAFPYGALPLQHDFSSLVCLVVGLMISAHDRRLRCVVGDEITVTGARFDCHRTRDLINVW